MANPADVTNPGLVNVANQGFDFLPRPDQPITVTPEPRDDGVLVSPLAFAPSPPPTLTAGFPTPAEAFPASIPALPPSFSLGTPEPEAPEIFVDDQDSVVRDPPVAEFVVTEVGSLQINDTGDVVEIEIEVVGATLFGPPDFEAMFKIDVQMPSPPAPPGVPPLDGRFNPRVQVTMLGREVEFLSAPNAGQTRIIVGFSGDFLVVKVSEFGTSPIVVPAAGDMLAITIDREASEVFFQLTGIPVNVNPSTETVPEPAPVVVAPDVPSLGNFFPESAPSFIGSGDFAPPLQGTFQVERQTYGVGLPANVFVP